jgi:hypothetical protein
VYAKNAAMESPARRNCEYQEWRLALSATNYL